MRPSTGFPTNWRWCRRWIFSPPIADDPYLFGQIAATNALSDVYAMGGEPKLALNILCIPEKMPKSAVHELLRGGYDKVYEAGAIITGGHSILDEEPKYGLAVTGFVHPDRVLTNAGARPGDVLILTKPLGIGVLTTAAKAELCPDAAMERAQRLMTTLNKSARDIMVKYRVHACTDVTGFGFLGHLCEMMQGSGTAAEIQVDQMDLIPEALDLARMGILPEGMYRNRRFAEAAVDAGDTELARQDLLYDPQTAGGLLMGHSPRRMRRRCSRSWPPQSPAPSGWASSARPWGKHASSCADGGDGGHGPVHLFFGGKPAEGEPHRPLGEGPQGLMRRRGAVEAAAGQDPRVPAPAARQPRRCPRSGNPG